LILGTDKGDGGTEGSVLIHRGQRAERAPLGMPVQ
jgi:hypothetical protein